MSLLKQMVGMFLCITDFMTISLESVPVNKSHSQEMKSKKPLKEKKSSKRTQSETLAKVNIM